MVGSGSNVPGVTGKVVVVTGASGGIGSATAHAFIDAGASVWLLDRDEAVLKLGATLGVPASQVDVRDSGDVDSAFGSLVGQLGAPSSLIHAAGVLSSGPVDSLTDADWFETMQVNATGTMNVTRAAARVMAGPASITVIGSNAGATPRAGMAAYGASKAAATSFVRSLGLELAHRGIRCNIISPGSTDTDMLRGMWSSEDESEKVIAGDPSRYRLGIPLRRIAKADDIAASALFLASDAARHITLHDLRVDGGATLDA
ncbi:SDR family oxidoreductase [Rhodococcus sp. NPDC058521]|uniref:SDR family oxidoreductase n=1 Tax=Rhodococcus sp. NPDC058521 TaxID=3346536 RepID=UPI00366277B4